MSGTILNFDGKEAAVLGVGINVLQDLAANETATSLTSLREQIVGPDVQPPPVTREDVLASFCNELERLLGLSAAAGLDEYRTTCSVGGRSASTIGRARRTIPGTLMRRRSASTLMACCACGPQAADRSGRCRERR